MTNLKTSRWSRNWPALLILGALILTACGPEMEPDFEPMFDGKTFAGWEGSTEFFRIENQAIVAGANDRQIPKNQFLCTEQTYADFDLRMQVKFTTTNNNGGIQFRSMRIPNHHEVIGYQADVGYTSDGPVWGAMYDESRRNRFLVEPKPDRLSHVLKANDWNDYRIVCEGPHIRFWLNDEPILDYTEEDANISQRGIICVQIHSGPASEAWYRHIRIKEINGH